MVFELFQDLDRFSLDDYKPLADIDESKSRLTEFLHSSVEANGGSYRQVDDNCFELAIDSNAAPVMCTLNRDLAQDDDSIVLLGIDHKITGRFFEQWRAAAPSLLGVTATIGLDQPVVLSIWLVHSFGSGADTGTHLVPIAVDEEGKRVPSIEKQYSDCFSATVRRPLFEETERANLLHEHIEPTLQREIGHRGIANPETGYSTELLAWVEVS